MKRRKKEEKLEKYLRNKLFNVRLLEYWKFVNNKPLKMKKVIASKLQKLFKKFLRKSF